MAEQVLVKTEKYDWPALKIEWLGGDWKNFMSFREAKGIPAPRHNNYVRDKTKGWIEEKRQVVQKSIQKATNDIVNRGSVDIQKAMGRQANLARWLQLKGAAALKDLSPKDADEARKLIVSGMKEERAALNANNKGGSQNLTQVNVNLPKTKFDEMLDGLDYEGLLSVIAEIKRLRVRKLGEGIDVEGQTSAD